MEQRSTQAPSTAYRDSSRRCKGNRRRIQIQGALHLSLMPANRRHLNSSLQSKNAPLMRPRVDPARRLETTFQRARLPNCYNGPHPHSPRTTTARRLTRGQKPTKTSSPQGHSRTRQSRDRPPHSVPRAMGVPLARRRPHFAQVDVNALGLSLTEPFVDEGSVSEVG